MGLAVRAAGLEKSYRAGLIGRRRVLGPLDLELARGARLGLVGPNGSGKSTLLALLAGIERPTRGLLEVLGGSPAAGAVRARIGYCPEDSPFPSELSGRAALDLLGRLQGLGRRERRPRVEAWLARAGLMPAASRALGTYSRGMLRRLALAQALLAEPELVLLDEPTAGLDAEGYLLLEQVLGELRARETTLIFCSHALAEVHAQASELLVLLGGTLAARGSIDDWARARGAVELELAGASAELLAEIRASAERAGAKLLALRPAGRVLLELYRRAERGAAPPEAAPPEVRAP